MPAEKSMASQLALLNSGGSPSGPSRTLPLAPKVTQMQKSRKRPMDQTRSQSKCPVMNFSSSTGAPATELVEVAAPAAVITKISPAEAQKTTGLASIAGFVGWVDTGSSHCREYWSGSPLSLRAHHVLSPGARPL